jgi:uncharacterized membrane protein (UPF0127 family)
MKDQGARVGFFLLTLFYAAMLMSPETQSGAAHFGHGVVVIHSRPEAARIEVEIAATPPALQSGLSARTQLEDNHGMLLVFPGEQKIGLQHKDIRLPLDDIYLDAKGMIVKIDADVAPSAAQRIQPDMPVQKLLQVPAGLTRKYDIHVGDLVTYE